MSDPMVKLMIIVVVYFSIRKYINYKVLTAKSTTSTIFWWILRRLTSTQIVASHNLGRSQYMETGYSHHDLETVMEYDDEDEWY